MGEPLSRPGAGGEESPRLPPRPTPDRPFSERCAAWVAWFGVGRLVLAAVSVLVVTGGVAWLVRAEPPTVEATLPTTSGSPPTVTLPTAAATTVAPVSGPAAPAGDVSPTSLVAVGPVVVHVAGAVAAPGVYELPGGVRVDDAIVAAGGALPDAELDVLNLAQPLLDGQRVYVPLAGELGDAEVAAGSPELVTPVGPSAGVSVGTGSQSAVTPDRPVDVNRATADELDTLPGVGPSTAQAIVDERERNGPFATVDDLDRVPGIGPSKLAALRDLVTV